AEHVSLRPPSQIRALPCPLILPLTARQNGLNSLACDYLPKLCPTDGTYGGNPNERTRRSPRTVRLFPDIRGQSGHSLQARDYRTPRSRPRWSRIHAGFACRLLLSFTFRSPFSVF